MIQRIGSIGLGIHLGLVFLHNICAIAPQVTAIPSAVDPIRYSAQQLYTQPGLRHYAQLAGIHGCYGFYSPQVGSIYSSRIDVHDERAGTVYQLSYPGLRRNASKIRYCSLLESVTGWRHEGEQSEAPLLARATAQSIYNSIKRQYPTKEVRLLIYTIHTPSLNEIRSKKQTTKMITPIYEQPIQQKPSLYVSEHFL